uniref:Mandelate racemase/muconate lactonizing enzyme C-terminal domain-containing protein n=1 Tax=Romanomermis culicivorax TaxID=13658 RepID=A0A915K1J8_ROMCU
MKVGLGLENDQRRAQLIRSIIGYSNTLMMDANQVWNVDTALANMDQLQKFKPLWIEEPTSPDDILGHKVISESIKKYGIGVATGEHCQNRVMFKQFLQSGAMQFCQIDACRVGSINELLAIILLAAKFG